MSKSPPVENDISISNELIQKLLSEIEKVIFGQKDLIIETMCTFLAGGHILITGAPGLAKTTLVRIFAQKLGLEFGRIQFTPDLLPSDILGSEVLNMQSINSVQNFVFLPGPIFVNLLLADEINRASPRTQSAMLEAMQERQVTIGGKVHTISSPFMVFATQNPFESEGTFPLPEAQLDRFLLHSIIEYPNQEAELKILNEHANNHLIGEGNIESDNSSSILNINEISSLIKACQKIPIQSELVNIVNELIRSTRPQDQLCPNHLKPSLWYGAGPRAGISLISICRSLALLEQDKSVRWRHIKRMAKPVLRHRIKITNNHNEEVINSEDKMIELLLANIEERHTNLLNK